MGENILISKDLLDCPLCGEVHEIELWSRISRAVVKNEIVEYREHVYKCKNCSEDDNEFVSGKFLDANLQAARNAYHETNKFVPISFENALNPEEPK